MAAELEEVVSGELVPAEASRTLFRTDDPAEVLEAAKSIAAVLGPALKANGMTQRIGQSEHVKIEGWQTLGAMLGVTPHTIWSRPARRPGTGGRRASRPAPSTAAPVGSAEGMCSRNEKTWKRKEDQELRSMAQTRAMSKALAAPLRFIVTLSGLSGTPAEEATVPEPFGPQASSKEIRSLERAAGVLYGGESTGVQELMDHIERDADGYIPRVVARALMLTAAHRPQSPNEEDAGAGEDVTPQNTAPAGESNSEGVSEDPPEPAP